MKQFFVALVCAGLISATQAQTASQLITPTPLSIIITAGRWIIENQQQFYYIEVQGQGDTFEQARGEAFRLAVEQAVGTIIVSESVAQNQKLIRDEIITYASGYVNRYEITDRLQQNGQTVVRMKVWVARNNLSKRLLNRSEVPGQVDGTQASAQVETVLQERYAGDRLFQTVLNDYPKRAFVFELGRTDVFLDQTRQTKLRIPFRLKFSPYYLESLESALSATSQTRGPNVSVVQIFTGKWFNSGGGVFGFTDNFKVQQIYQTMVLSRPAVRLTVGQKTQKCYRWAELDQMVNYQYPSKKFVTIGRNHAVIHGNFVLNAYIEMYVNQLDLEQIDQIQLEVIPGNTCLN